MTKLRKWLVAGLMVIVTFCVTLGSALLNVTQSIFTKMKASAQTDYAYSNTNGTDALIEGKVVMVEGIAKSATLKDTEGVVIPKTPKVFEMKTDGTLAEVASDKFEVVVEVKNPYGDFLVNKSVLNAAQVSVDASTGNYILKPSQVGMYTVQYAVKSDGVWTLSNIYQINVSAKAYTYDFIANDTIVMPSKIDTRAKDDDNVAINKNVDISLPIFYDEKGKIIDSFVLGNDNAEYIYVAEYKTFKNVFFDENNAYPTVLADTPQTSANGRNIYEKYSTYQIKRVPAADANTIKTTYGLLVEVSVPGEDTKTNSTYSTSENRLKLNDSLFEGDECFYAKNPYNFDATSGKNIVTYKLCNKSLSDYETPYAYANKVINGTDAYNSTNIAVGASTTKTIKSSDTSIKEKIYLPEVNVVDNNENKNAINAYYYYNVKYITEDGPSTSKDKVVMGVDEDGVYFIPQEKGTYNISYNARDFYNNEDANYAKYDYNVTVNDRKAPIVYLVDTYNYKTFTKTDAEQARDMSYIIPKKAVIAAEGKPQTEIAIPALYTYDKATEDSNKLIVEITISSKDAFLDGTADKKQVKNFSLDVQRSGSGETTFDAEKTYKNVIYYKEVAKGTYPDFYVKNVDGESVFYGNDDVRLTKEALIKAKSSQTAYVKIDPTLFGEGKYVVEYSVTDGSGNSNETAKTFEFELVKEDATKPMDETAPTVEFGSLSVGNVTDNQEISISIPKIQDNIDTNTLNRYYVLVEGKTNTDPSQEVKEYLEITPKYNETTKKYDLLTFNTANEIVTGKSIYKLANSLKERNFKILAFAFDDVSDETAEAIDPTTIDITDIEKNYKNIGFDSYTVTLLAEEDEVTPYISARTTEVTTENNAYNQFSTVSVNGIKFYDDTATARVKVQVFDSKGNTYAVEELSGYSVKALSTPKNINNVLYNYEYNFPGVKFTANKADNYTINYTVVDNGRNSASYSFVLRAATDKEAPVIDGVLGTYETLELGETFYLNTLTAKDNDPSSNIYYSFEVIGENVGNKSSWFNPETKQFTPEAADTYTITVKASDKEVDGNFSTRTFVVKFVDSKKPTLNIVEGSTNIITIQEKENDGEDNEYTEDTTDVIDWSNNKFPSILLPIFAVTDYNQEKDGFQDVLTATGTITITTPDNDSYTIDINGVINGENPLNMDRITVEGQEKFVFTPTSRGHYVVKYNGEDKAGNKADTQTIDVYIGDTEDPVITLNDLLSNSLKNGFTLGQNAKIVIDPKLYLTKAVVDGEDVYKTGASSDVSVTDNFGFKTIPENQKVYTNLSVQVVDSNNSTVSQQENNDGLICYTFDKAGTYTITFTVTDGVGNSGKISKTFKVSANTSSATDTAKILGTVLIVVSIVILAGVVIYFVKGTKMLPKRKKAKKQQKETQDKKED